MNLKVIVAVILIVLGVLGLVYKGFNYKSNETVLDLGPIKATAEVEKTADIPAWASVAVIALGAGILVFARR
ncbi:MAG: hypothetical protein AAGK14_13440 [Verrucomicrobiota bacterium]